MGVDRRDVEAEIQARCAEADWSGAVTAALHHYGPEILGFLFAALRDHDDAREAFSLFNESLWRALPGLRWESSFRTWAYTLARSALLRLQRERYRRARQIGWSQVPEGFQEAAIARSATAPHLRSEVKSHVQRVRASLHPDDQMILTLRIDRGMSWRDIAVIMAGEGASETDVARQSALLRKRFERLKTRLRGLCDVQATA